MSKFKTVAIPMLEGTYHCLADIVENDHIKNKLSGDWVGNVICLEDLGLPNASIDDFEIENAIEDQPFFLTINGALLSVVSQNTGAYYPCAVNARGYEFDSCTAPTEDECYCRIMKENPKFNDGIYFTKDIGTFETWHN